MEEGYSTRATLEEIAKKNDYNLNISRYVSNGQKEAEIDLAATHTELVKIEKALYKEAAKHNRYLRELGLPPLPSPGASLSSE